MSESYRLYYKCRGSGPPIVLIAGLNATHQFWELSAQHLEKEFLLITPDNQGIGNSNFVNTICSTEKMAADIIFLLDYLGIQSAHIVGHSLGGCVAQQIAIHYPERINKLVLCSTISKVSHLKKYQIETTIEMLKCGVPELLIVRQAIASLYSNSFFKNTHFVDFLTKTMLFQTEKQYKKSYLYQINALLSHDTFKMLKNISATTLVIGGDEDIFVTPQELKIIAEKIKNSSFLLVKEAAHMLPIENAALFSQVVTKFLYEL